MVIKSTENFWGFFLLLGAIIFVVFFNYESLSDPFFWDELGVYGKGVHYLYNHGISILPNAMPPEISRGHPLLFYAIHAIALKLFGNSLVVSHSFSLILSLSLLVVLYKTSRLFTSNLIAGISCVLLAIQPIFLAQSTLVLPEITVALIALSSFYFFVRKKYLTVAFLLSIGVLIKESMIIIPAFFILIELLYFARKKEFSLENLKTTFWLMTPFFVFSLFLIIQYFQNGWFFFPYHTELIENSTIIQIPKHIARHLWFIFMEQGRLTWLLALLVSSFLLLLKKEKKAVGIALLFVLYNIVWFGFAFYMDRYLLYVYPFIVLIISAGLNSIGKKKLTLVLISSIMILPTIFSYYTEGFRYDANLEYRDVVEVSTMGIDRVYAEVKTEEIYANFPLNFALASEEGGYISTSENLKNLSWVYSEDTKYSLLYSHSPTFDFNDNYNYKAIEVYRKRNAKVGLFSVEVKTSTNE